MPNDMTQEHATDVPASTLVEPAADSAGELAAVIKPIQWDHSEGFLEGQLIWTPSEDMWPCWIVKNRDSESYVWCEEISIQGAPASPVHGVFPTLEDAIKAAEDDYQARMATQITLRPAPEVRAEGVNDGLAKAVAAVEAEIAFARSVGGFMHIPVLTKIRDGIAALKTAPAAAPEVSKDREGS